MKEEVQRHVWATYLQIEHWIIISQLQPLSSAGHQRDQAEVGSVALTTARGKEIRIQGLVLAMDLEIQRSRGVIPLVSRPQRTLPHWASLVLAARLPGGRDAYRGGFRESPGIRETSRKPARL